LLFALAVPFLGRAHSMDDPLYLAAARHLLAHPFDPLGASTFWHDRPSTLFFDSYNPPLAAYLLALPVAAAGGSEAAVHLLMLGLAAWALIVARRVGAALGVGSDWSLVLAASPVLAVCSVTALADVPFLLLTLLSWDAAFAGRGLRAGVLAGLSALTKYSGVLNLLLVLGPLRGRGRLADAASGPILVAGWYFWTAAAYGAPHPAVAGRHVQLGLAHQAELLASFVAGLGLAGLPALVPLLRWDARLARLSLVAGLAAAALALPAYGPLGASVAAAAFASGTALLAAAARATAARGGWPALAFWLPSAYAGLVVYFGTARYALPLLPPLVWLLVRGGQVAEPSRLRLRLRLAVGAGAAASLALLWGDARYAGAFRTLAARLPEDGRCLSVGHWGFQHYAGLAGCATLDPRQDLARDDVVVEAEGVHAAPPSPAQLALLRDAGRLSEPSPALRVMDPLAGAGLWSSAWGLLPWSVRFGAEERVAVRRVQAWLAEAGTPLDGEVALDLGTLEARQAMLDGWSGDEAFEEGSERRSFVWSVGPEAALRVPLPPGATRLRITAFPSPAAVGELRVRAGDSAEAVVPLEPGWHDHDVPLRGAVDGGPTTILLAARGFERPGLRGERRPLAVAVDRLALGTGAGAPVADNVGAWPSRVADGPGLFVAHTAAVVVRGRGGDQVDLRVVSERASLTWRDEFGQEEVLWRGASGTEPVRVRLLAPPRRGWLVVRARRAFVTELVQRPAGRADQDATGRSPGP
jgi:hypothetical protein